MPEQTYTCNLKQPKWRSAACTHWPLFCNQQFQIHFQDIICFISVQISQQISCSLDDGLRQTDHKPLLKPMLPYLSHICVTTPVYADILKCHFKVTSFLSPSPHPHPHPPCLLKLYMVWRHLFLMSLLHTNRTWVPMEHLQKQKQTQQTQIQQLCISKYQSYSSIHTRNNLVRFDTDQNYENENGKLTENVD